MKDFIRKSLKTLSLSTNGEVQLSSDKMQIIENEELDAIAGSGPPSPINPWHCSNDGNCRVTINYGCTNDGKC